MSRCILNLLSAGTLLGLNAVPALAAERNSLQGTWVAVTAERNGSLAWDIKGHLLTIQDDRFEVCGADNRILFQGTFQVGNQRPAAIDFLHAGNPLQGKTWKGIYESSMSSMATCSGSATTAPT